MRILRVAVAMVAVFGMVGTAGAEMIWYKHGAYRGEFEADRAACVASAGVPRFDEEYIKSGAISQEQGKAILTCMLLRNWMNIERSAAIQLESQFRAAQTPPPPVYVPVPVAPAPNWGDALEGFSRALGGATDYATRPPGGTTCTMGPGVGYGPSINCR